MKFDEGLNLVYESMSKKTVFIENSSNVEQNVNMLFDNLHIKKALFDLIELIRTELPNLSVPMVASKQGRDLTDVLAKTIVEYGSNEGKPLDVMAHLSQKPQEPVKNNYNYDRDYEENDYGNDGSDDEYDRLKDEGKVGPVADRRAREDAYYRSRRL